SNYLQILENRYIYGYKTQRILKILEQIKEVINKLNLDFEKLKEAAIYMNIGLFMMPDKVVLNFEEDLSEEEKNLYEIHPILGGIYLNLLNYSDMEVKQTILDHHENIDGSGFPSKKKGEEISPYAKVLRILDDFDSISYKENKETAIKFLSENKGKYYDENILNEILPVLEKIEIKEEIVIPDEILALYKKVLEREEAIKLPKFLEKIELDKNEREENSQQENEK
ncbi:MAG TPA: HD domain-containing protein, partial [Desulfurobacteriaceae bacterium]|nr:HD domain-containing protein [Desulfurobacteriaceae bacterium]